MKNSAGKPVLLKMVAAVQQNKDYLSEVDGLIADGDHGMNMNKGFTMFAAQIADREIKGINTAGQSPAPTACGGFPQQSCGVLNPVFPHSLDHVRTSASAISLISSISFSDGLDELGNLLFSQIGGSMGPIYGTTFMDMAEAAGGIEEIDLASFAVMLGAGLAGLQDVVEAKVGDKTLIDTLVPANEAIQKAAKEGKSFTAALGEMKAAAIAGRDSTKDLAAKFGRSSRLGERSRGVLDAGAVSCCLILCAMADGILELE